MKILVSSLLVLLAIILVMAVTFFVLHSLSTNPQDVINSCVSEIVGNCGITY